MSDRVLGSGISLPQWIRGKPDGGFDPSTLSPPTYDDDFFQIKYNNKPTIVEPPQSGYRILSSVLSEGDGQSPQRPRGIDEVNSECTSSVVSVAHKMLRLQPPSQRQRRNSKSLPASPLGSPETRRRIVNRFFTTSGNNTDDESKDIGGSSSSILEALSKERNIRAKSTAPEARMELLPQPSEYREMNFWSPTSM